MKKASFHRYHISMLGSMLDHLKSSGVSLDSLTRGTQISKFDLNSPSTYLPIMVFYEFLEKVRYSQGIDHLSVAYYKDFKVEELSDFGSYLTKCHDLQSVLEEGVRLNHQVQTNGNLHLDIKGHTSFFYMTHLDRPSMGRKLSEEIEFTMMLEAVQMVLGNDWTPISVFLTTEKGYWIERLFFNTDFRVHTNSSFMGFEIKTEDLKRINPGYDAKILPPENANEISLSDKVTQIMSNCNTNNLPILEECASYYGVSSRTAVRVLAQEGTSFSKIRQKNMETRAIQLLKNEQLSIKDIALQLGYSNAPNFIRAFKNWLDLSPDRFRNTL
jgi:AraC-like DNA-binding protein